MSLFGSTMPPSVTAAMNPATYNAAAVEACVVLADPGPPSADYPGDAAVLAMAATLPAIDRPSTAFAMAQALLDAALASSDPDDAERAGPPLRWVLELLRATWKPEDH